MLRYPIATMPLVGEKVFAPWARNPGDDMYTASWEYNMGPTPALAKAFISEFMSLDGKSAGLAYISRIRQRKPDGSDTDEHFPTHILLTMPYSHSLMVH
jgi:hypothetical protein